MAPATGKPVLVCWKRRFQFKSCGETRDLCLNLVAGSRLVFLCLYRDPGL
jgi:hypothetical protein